MLPRRRVPHPTILPHLVVVSAEVFEVPKADVTQADHNGDHKDHKGEHGCGGQEPWGKGKPKWQCQKDCDHGPWLEAARIRAWPGKWLSRRLRTGMPAQRSPVRTVEKKRSQKRQRIGAATT